MTFDPKSGHPFDIVKGAVFETPMYYVTVMVNGDMARDLLLYNREPQKDKESTNRKASQVVVNDYAGTMLQDKWYLSPQPLILSFKDPQDMAPEEIEEMIDGQQRLKAVVQASQVRADIEVPFVICFDAPKPAKWLLDMGKKRQPGDFLRMQGEENSGRLANALRMLYAVEELRPFKSVNLWRHIKFTPQDQAAYLAKHASLRQGLAEARATKTLFQPHVGAVLFYLVQREYSLWTALALFEGLATGASLPHDDARLKVREFISIKNAPVRGTPHRWDGFEQLAVLFTATNAWLRGDTGYKPGLTFSKLSSTFPELVKRDQMPVTVIVPGNDPQYYR